MGWFGTTALAQATTVPPTTLRLRGTSRSIDVDVSVADAVEFLRIGEAFGLVDEGWWAMVSPQRVIVARSDCPMLDVTMRDRAMAAAAGQMAVVWLLSRPAALRGAADGIAILDRAAYTRLTRDGVRETVRSIDDIPRID